MSVRELAERLGPLRGRFPGVDVEVPMAAPETEEALIDLVRAAGEGDLLKYGVNSQSLRARVKELDASETGIPEGLQPFIETTEAYKIRIRRG